MGSVLDPRGEAAARIEVLWWIMFALGVLVFAFFVVSFLVGVRRDAGAGSPIERRDDHEGSSRRWILGAGVIAPSIIIAIVFVATVWSMRASSQAAPDDALVIEVTGHQWWWEVSYPAAGVVSANEVHVPAGVRVEIELRSADVIHSFWVPALAGKLDALPERTNVLALVADEPGRYAGRCAEFCGIQHTNQDFVLIAHEPAEFERWLAERGGVAAAPTSAEARRGAELFASAGCGSCHRVAGIAAGGAEPAPDLTDVASRWSILGGMLEPSVPDLRTWIAEPHSVKPGALMPPAELDDDEIAAVAAWIETLT